MATIQIKYRDIPSSLHASVLFRSFATNDPEGVVDIPSDCFPGDFVGTDLDMLSRLCRVRAYWGLDEIPLDVLYVCRDLEVEVWEAEIAKLPQGVVEPHILNALKTAYSPEVLLSDICKPDVPFEILIDVASRLDKDCGITTSAARAGNLKALEYVHKKGFSWHADTCPTAIQTKSYSCFQYAIANGCPCDSEAYEYAAQEGDIRSMEILRGRGIPLSPKTCSFAALGGQLDALIWALENGCVWNSEIVANAAQVGHIGCLQYALINGCPHDGKASRLASEFGHIACLQLLFRYNNPWDELTSIRAAAHADSSCLEYLHQNGCPWDERTPEEAALQGCVSTLRYALERGCPYHRKNLMQCASKSADLACLQYLIEDYGIFMDTYLFGASLLKGNMPCLQYIIDQGCPYTGVGFTSAHDQYRIFDTIFTQNNPEFVTCLDFMLERGWVPNADFQQYIFDKDYDNCEDLFVKHGWPRKVQTSFRFYY